MRRIVAAAALALAALTGGGGVAVAEPTPAPTPATSTPSTTTPTPRASPSVKLPKDKHCIKGECITSGDDPPAEGEGPGLVAPDPVTNPCLRTPTADMPWSRAAGIIDPGPDTPAPGSMYGDRGYGGFAVPIYDPGCAPGLNTMQKRMWDAPSFLAESLIGIALVEIAVATVAARYALDVQSIGGLLDSVAYGVQIGLGLRLLVLGGVVAAGIAAVLLLVRTWRDASLPDVAKGMAGLTVIGMLAVGFALNATLIGPTYDKASHATFTAVSSVASGGDLTGRADTTTADALIRQAVFPMWSTIMLGSNQKAKDEFAWRLYAAQSFTRQEADDADKAGNMAAVVKLKKTQFDQVAQEVKVKYPDAYEHLAGAETGPRIGPAVVLILGVSVAVPPLVVALVIIFVARIIVRGVVAIFPTGALLWVMPAWQVHVVRLARVVQRVIVAALIACVVFVAWMVFGVGGIVASGQPIGARVFVLAVLAGILVWAWRNRKSLTGKVVKRIAGDDVSPRVRKTAAAVAAPVKERAARLAAPVTGAASGRFARRAAASKTAREATAEQRKERRARVERRAAARFAARRATDAATLTGRVRASASRRAGAYRGPNRKMRAPERRVTLPARTIATRTGLAATKAVAPPQLRPALAVAARVQKVVKTR